MRTISVALATFNGGTYLRAQLESIARQHRLPDELVICDDASTDNTLEIIDAFARSAPFPVRVHRNSQRLGYRRNFLKAAKLSTGDLISFSDQDDVWEDRKLQTIESTFSDPQVLFAFHNAILVDQRLAPLGHMFSGTKPRIYQPLELPAWSILPGFAQTIDRTLLDFIDLHELSRDSYCSEECMPHDQWFPFIASVMGRTQYISEPLVRYRQHRKNTSGWLPAKPLAYVFHGIVCARQYARSTSDALATRIVILEEMQARRPACTRIRCGLEHYRSIEQYARLRAKLYNSKSLRTRLTSALKLIKGGAYSKPVIQLGWENLILDLVVGVPAGHVLREA
jgi:glycosyltransferase involved in cell wall biosynthesis